MMDLPHVPGNLLLAYSIYVVGTASPGPSNLMLMATAMNAGRKAALAMALGVVSGCALLGLLVFCGYAMAFSTAAAVRHYRCSHRGFDGLLAVVFGYAGIRLLASAR